MAQIRVRRGGGKQSVEGRGGTIDTWLLICIMCSKFPNVVIVYIFIHVYFTK